MTPIETLTEKQAIKELVDTFSNLADIKDVAAQDPLFTEDGHVTTYIGGELFAEKPCGNRGRIHRLPCQFQTCLPFKRTTDHSLAK